MNTIKSKSNWLIIIWSLLLLIAIGMSVFYAYEYIQLENHAELIEQRLRDSDGSMADRQQYAKIMPHKINTLQCLEFSVYFLAFFALQLLLICIKNQHKLIQFVCRSATAVTFWIINLYFIKMFIERTSGYPLFYLLIILPIASFIWIFLPQIKAKYASDAIDKEYAQHNGMAYFHFYPHPSESVSMTNNIILQFALMAACIVIVILFFPSKKFISTAPALFGIALLIKSMFYKKYERNFTVNEYLSMVLATIFMSVTLSVTELLIKLGSFNWQVAAFTFMVVLSIQTIIASLVYFPYKRGMYYISSTY